MSKAWKVTMLPLYQRCWSIQTRMGAKIMKSNLSEARFSWETLIRLRFLPITGIEHIWIAWSGIMLPRHQLCSSTPKRKKENIRVVHTFVTNITANFLSMLKLLHRTGIEPISITWEATMLPLHQLCCATEIRMVDNTTDLNLLKQGLL